MRFVFGVMLGCFGLIKGIYVDDAIVGRDPKGRVKIHADKLNLLGRLGTNEYVNLGDILTRERPI